MNKCYSCGAELKEGQEHCPECGLRQYRVCYCGTKLRRNVERCPECGANWTRISSRRRRSAHKRKRAEVYYIAVGALCAVALAAIVAATVRGLQEGGAAAIADGATRLAAFAGQHGLAIAGVILVAAIGAAGGAVTYRLRRSFRRDSRRRSADATKR